MLTKIDVKLAINAQVKRKLEIEFKEKNKAIKDFEAII